MYLIKYELCEQVSPEDWAMQWKEKIVTKDTTIGEIVDWFEQKEKKSKQLPKFFPEMKLSQPDK